MADPIGNGSMVGRTRELVVLESFVQDTGAGGSTLLLTGDPGIGKSVLLDAAAATADDRGIRVIRGEGIEYESSVSFAGLHQLVDRLGNDLRKLPPPSREALHVALGVGTGPAPDRLALSQAALALFRVAAAEAPLLIVIDDMHWLDRASAAVMGFVGRRVSDTHVSLLGATRPGAGGFFERTGWPELVVPPLDDRSAMELLARQPVRLSARTTRSVIGDAQGNPLALSEFAAAASTLEAGSPDPRSQSASSREIRALFASRIDRLPSATQRLLLLAALDGSERLSVLAQASGPDGVDALGPAERDHLVIVDDHAGGVRFRHPMIKSVVVEQSTHEDRRTAHSRLAQAFAADPERRGHHVAEAALAPDEATADLIEAGATRTLQRGDVVGAVGRLLRAAELSPGHADRSRRLIQAALIGAFTLGELENSSHLIRAAVNADPGQARTLDAVVATTYLLLNTEGDAAVAQQLLSAAITSALAESDRDQQSFSHAVHTMVMVCHFAGRVEYWSTFDDLLASMGDEAPTDARLMAEIFAAPIAAPAWALDELDRLIVALDGPQDVEHVIRVILSGFYADRLARCRPALDRVAYDGEDDGAAAAALMALSMISFDELNAGRWDAADQAAAQSRSLAEHLGYTLFGLSAAYASALVAARRGDLETCAHISATLMEWARPRQLGRLEDFAHHALGEAALGVADYERAYEHALAITVDGPGTLHPHDPQAMWSAFDMVEAAVRTSRTDEAVAHAHAMQTSRMSRLSPRLTLTTAAALAMVAADDVAPDMFERALGASDIESWPFEVARVRLVYGERLRRLRRMREARVQLQAAQQGFDRLGAAGWSERAATELRATAAARHVGPAAGVGSLTPQEFEVAQLAALGLTNRDIAARLFVSPRTVSAHLYRIFPKLGISSRAALRDALSGPAAEGSHIPTRSPRG